MMDSHALLAEWEETFQTLETVCNNGLNQESWFFDDTNWLTIMGRHDIVNEQIDSLLQDKIKYQMAMSNVRIITEKALAKLQRLPFDAKHEIGINDEKIEFFKGKTETAFKILEKISTRVDEEIAYIFSLRPIKKEQEDSYKELEKAEYSCGNIYKRKKQKDNDHGNIQKNTAAELDAPIYDDDFNKLFQRTPTDRYNFYPDEIDVFDLHALQLEHNEVDWKLLLVHLENDVKLILEDYNRIIESLQAALLEGKEKCTKDERTIRQILLQHAIRHRKTEFFIQRVEELFVAEDHSLGSTRVAKLLSTLKVRTQCKNLMEFDTTMEMLATKLKDTLYWEHWDNFKKGSFKCFNNECKSFLKRKNLTNDGLCVQCSKCGCWNIIGKLEMDHRWVRLHCEEEVHIQQRFVYDNEEYGDCEVCGRVSRVLDANHWVADAVKLSHRDTSCGLTNDHEFPSELQECREGPSSEFESNDSSCELVEDRHHFNSGVAEDREDLHCGVAYCREVSSRDAVVNSGDFGLERVENREESSHDLVEDCENSSPEVVKDNEEPYHKVVENTKNADREIVETGEEPQRGVLDNREDPYCGIVEDREDFCNGVVERTENSSLGKMNECTDPSRGVDVEDRNDDVEECEESHGKIVIDRQDSPSGVVKNEDELPRENVENREDLYPKVGQS